MAEGYRKRIKRGLLGSLALVCFWQGEVVMAQAEKMQEGPASMVFTKHCVGRFEFELPQEMQLLTSGYGQPQFFINIYHQNNTDRKKGVITGEHRLEQWLAYVEELRSKADRYRPTKYVIKDLERELKTVVFYEGSRRSSPESNTKHKFASFFFKDFPEQQLGLSVEGSANKFIARNAPNVDEILQQRLHWMRQAIDKIEYQPWPHKQAGVCLQRNLLVANLQPLKDELGDYHENYGAEFFNGADKGSMFKVLVNVYGKGEEKALKEELSRYSGMMAFFASSKTKVAGREGRLFISDGKYSDTQREFTWVSTDSKINSVRYAHMEISGKIEIEDFPAMAPLNATEMIVGLLKGVRVRENGMVGVKD
ncbi:hypothetical protein C8J23_15024 [Shewanella chilikensis]|uniref:Tle cognate immunity protein 4 C-terminal domain-containing protein n=3 Tax=Shewanella TaxID=22 RepID=A0ABX5PI42_9GAMM|nr:hypothetical protein [Shewanella chilikensis]MCL1153539.1 hypothetical protein [Shewanella chilikensis]PYE54308.1 hypothetical protein C8J23_15024 [Shewanella chilikensis]GGZ48838.1 hypothetical protein GCM10007105_38270 [Shewanella chilikensis]